jgi:hypothetical protein
MTKPRRNIKFNHRGANGHATGLDGRRSSFSDISEGGSDHTNEKQPANGGDVSQEVGAADVIS